MLKRISWALLAVVCVMGWSCATMRTRSCVETNASEYTLTVNGDGSVIPNCLTVKSGRTALTWQAGPSVTTLKVEFEGSGNHPPNPDCAGNRCTLARTAQLMNGQFSYDVTVVHGDHSTAQMDPILIIKPGA